MLGFTPFCTTKNLSLLKKDLFFVELLYSLPGGSVFLNISDSMQTCSLIFKGSLSVLLNLVSLLLSYLDLLSASLFYLLQSIKIVFLSKLFTSCTFSLFMVKPYFVVLVMFKLLVIFSMNLYFSKFFFKDLVLESNF